MTKQTTPFGYARIVVNLEGDKCLIEDVWNEGWRTGFEIDYDTLEGELLSQLPDGMTDAQVLCVFNYVAETSYSWEYGAYEGEDEYFPLISHTVLNTDYKSKWLDEIRAAESFYKDENRFKTEVSEWEELYDEEFVWGVKSEPKMITEEMLWED